jgi:hypothetical protein
MSKFEAKEAIESAVKYLFGQLNVLEDFLKEVTKEKKRSRAAAVFPLLVGISTAGKAILILTEARLATEVFVIARCLLERTVNYAYLMVADEREIKAFVDHGLQKGYLATSKKKATFNKLGHDYKIQPPNALLEEKIQTFTRNGRPTDWTSLSFRQRLNHLKNFCDSFDLSFYMNLYEDGSESVHGGFYGTLLHTGILSDAVCPAKGLQYINAYVTLTLCKLGDLIQTAFKAAASTKEFDLSVYLHRLENNRNVVDEVYRRMGAGEGSDS